MALTQISTDGIKNGTITGSDLATNIDLVDNQKLRIGTGNDLQIYHDGTDSVLLNSGVKLRHRSDIHIFKNNANNETLAKFNTNGTFNTLTFAGHFFYCNGFYQVN